MNNIKIIAGYIAVAALLTGCAYDQWAEKTNRNMNTSWTETLYGKQTVDNSALPKAMVVTDLRYGKGEGTGIPGPASSRFYDKLLGTLTYAGNCKNGLSFNVGMFNDAGVLIRNETIFVGFYTAGTTAQINKDVIADPLMQKSNQVTRLVSSGLRCM